MKKAIVLAFLALLVVVPVAYGYEIEDAGNVYWDQYAECDVASIMDAKLMERLVVVKGNEIVDDETVFTGAYGFTVVGTGMAISNPWNLSVETDGYEHGTVFQSRKCRWWEVYGDCGEGVITNTICTVPLDSEDNPIPTDAECCWDADVFTGTAPITIYLPLIYR